MAYNIGNFLRTLALPEAVEHWSLATLREKLIKIGARVVRHSRYITFQLAEVAIPRPLFAEILHLIDGLRPAPLPPSDGCGRDAVPLAAERWYDIHGFGWYLGNVG